MPRKPRNFQIGHSYGGTWTLETETGFAARNRVSSFECLVGIPKKNKRPQKLVPPEGILRGDLGVPG